MFHALRIHVIFLTTRRARVSLMTRCYDHQHLRPQTAKHHTHTPYTAARTARTHVMVAHHTTCTGAQYTLVYTPVRFAAITPRLIDAMYDCTQGTISSIQPLTHHVTDQHMLHTTTLAHDHTKQVITAQWHIALDTIEHYV